MTFLQSRGAWLASVLTAIPTGNPYNYVSHISYRFFFDILYQLTKLTDSSRSHLFDIITQYRAIFSDDNSSDDSLEYGSILFGWMNEIIGSYLTALEKDLPQINEGLSLQYLLDQCMYYGVSMGRVGVDFRGLLLPLFERCIFNLFTSGLSGSTLHFTETMRHYRFTNNINRTSNVTALGNSLHFKAFFSLYFLDTRDQILPPTELLDHPPVAVLANGYLTTLNELRHCAPLSLQSRLAEHLAESLYGVATMLQNYAKEGNKKLNSEEHKLFSHMCQV